jgi:cytochrome c biogenesis protein CcdA
MLREVYEILVGFTLVFTAFILSFMMVVEVLEKDILLSLLAYSMSLAGIVVGLHGVLGYVRERSS